MGCLTNIAVGVIGAFIGGALVGLFGGNNVIEFDLASLIVATVGAIILLLLVGLVRR